MVDHAEPGRASVSVIVPVWNVERYLRECLDSVVGQTIGLDRIEIIAVDDGSTDGSGSILDAYAARYPQVTVIHGPNSGGPGRPRNVGVDHAASTYVFFLDADDYLGPEALERLVGMAERNASDIVLGKLVGVEGRREYRATGVFRRSRDRVALEQAYHAANVLRLFRRSMIVRSGIRFGEGIAGGEDGDFMARMYFEASTISVVADYDCYFVRRREGSQSLRREGADDLLAYIDRLEHVRMEAVAAHRKPGASRDVLMTRHIWKLARKFGGSWRSLEPDERQRVFDAGAAVIRRWHTDRIQRRLKADTAIRIYCLQHGLRAELEDIVACPPRVAFHDPVVERGRIFARLPHFRDASGIPDSCFDITRNVVAQQSLKRAVVVDGRLELSGEAYLVFVGGATTVEIRRWPSGAVWRFKATAVSTPQLHDDVVKYEDAGFDVAIDLSTAAGGRPLPGGTWSIHLSVGTDRIRRTLPLRAPSPSEPAHGTRRSGATSERAVLSMTPNRELRLRIGRASRAARLLERAEAVYIRAERRLVRITTSLTASHRLVVAIVKLRPTIVGRLGRR